MSSKNPWENDEKNSRKKGGLGNDFLFDFIEKVAKKIWNFGSTSSSGRNGDPSLKFSFPTVVIVVCVLYFGSGFYQVQHNQRGVVLRFGEWVRTVGPGLQYILPYPFETVFLQKVTTVNQIDVGSFFKNQQDESLMLTGDSNLANISFSVLWKIKDDGVEDYLFNAKAPEITVRAVAESAMREVVGQTPFTYVQTEGRGEIQNKVRETLQAVMDEYRMGIEIIRVELQRVEPPASVIDSFRDVERAQAEQQSEKNKAEAYDRETRARTRGLIAEKLNSGEAQKRSIIETARGATARFLSAYSQYKLAPDIVSKRLYIETMRDIYCDVNKIVIDSDVKSVPYLPLTELAKVKNDKAETEK
ncbi:MAG: FtsH protease activity modulator HflK [Holosporaceae bacterium]|jgi:membrane protease subunit HflK|nr:FtsH protease activity modulator HflK [Holosporaceae bacterium]